VGIPTIAAQLTNGDYANRIACDELSGGSKSYPRFFRFSAQRFFIASDNRFLPAGVIPPRLARNDSKFLFDRFDLGEERDRLIDAVAFVLQLCKDFRNIQRCSLYSSPCKRTVLQIRQSGLAMS
jgi:hypothetical protein